MNVSRSIPEALLTKLIAFGRRGDVATALILEQIPELSQLAWIDRLAPEDWQRVGQPMSRSDVGALVKALVIFNKQVVTGGGSVAAAIWVYLSYVERFPDGEADLADWALRNRGTNPSIPFGRHSNATSWAEHQSIRGKKAR